MMPESAVTWHCDILIIADMCRRNDCGLRVRRDIQTYHQHGYSVGLFHLKGLSKNGTISPDIQRCLREGLARIVLPGQALHASLAIVLSPALSQKPISGLSSLRADKVVLVHDRRPDPAQMGVWFSFDLGQMSWAPTNRWVRQSLLELDLPVPIEEEDWRPVAGPVDPAPARLKPSQKIIVGRVSGQGGAQWPREEQALGDCYAFDASMEFRTLGAPPPDLIKDHAPANKWTMMNFADVAIERFIGMLDVVMYYPGAAVPELPDAAIATAMASGKIVVLPPHLRPHFGPGAIYAEPHDAVATIRTLFADQAALEAARTLAVEYCGYLFSAENQLRRVRGLISKAPQAPSTLSSTTANDKKRILFLTSNGIGLGHAARLLAIARRLDKSIDPMFATFGKSMSIIESFGYTAEYIPSRADIGAGWSEWDAWLRYEFGEMVNRLAPELVVFDGNNPSNGLINAALSNGQTGLAWVRRAMCPATPSPYLENSRFFDAIIEPGEYAANYDSGPTVSRRHEVIQVPPIRLLDHKELLSRKAARSKLGLSPDAPAVLLHLGGGANRDVFDLTDRIVQVLRGIDGLQIIIAEWSSGKFVLPHWPGTRTLRGFPISQYFNAFDFSVAAAGYNTFHEVLGFGLPTIFVANRHPSMDDQGARAAFAQENGAGFDLHEEEFLHLPALCNALLNKDANAVVRNNCLKFDQSNGAADAASILSELVNR